MIRCMPTLVYISINISATSRRHTSSTPPPVPTLPLPQCDESNDGSTSDRMVDSTAPARNPRNCEATQNPPAVPNYRLEDPPPGLSDNHKRLWKVARSKCLLYAGRGPVNYDVVKYLDVGNFDVRCSHCAVLFCTMEAQQIASDNGRFQMCCGKGKVTLPQLPPPPPNIQALFDGTHPLSATFKKNIIDYNMSLSLCGYMAKQLLYEHAFPYCYR
jgi:hypothetical protein